MQQTLFALLGMMTVTLMAFNQQRALIETRQAMINDEMEVMASGIALQAMEYIGNKSFDESLKGEGVPAWQPTRLKARNVQLTAQFPRAKRCTVLPEYEGAAGYATCDDLSDFNEMEPQRVPFDVGGQTVPFLVTTSVRYLNESRQPLTSGTSRHKEVVVRIEQDVEAGGPLLLRKPVYISRTFSIP